MTPTFHHHHSLTADLLNLHLNNLRLLLACSLQVTCFKASSYFLHPRGNYSIRDVNFVTSPVRTLKDCGGQTLNISLCARRKFVSAWTVHSASVAERFYTSAVHKVYFNIADFYCYEAVAHTVLIFHLLILFKCKKEPFFFLLLLSRATIMFSSVHVWNCPCTHTLFNEKNAACLH